MTLSTDGNLMNYSTTTNEIMYTNSVTVGTTTLNTNPISLNFNPLGSSGTGQSRIEYGSTGLSITNYNTTSVSDNIVLDCLGQVLLRKPNTSLYGTGQTNLTSYDVPVPLPSFFLYYGTSQGFIYLPNAAFDGINIGSGATITIRSLTDGCWVYGSYTGTDTAMYQLNESAVVTRAGINAKYSGTFTYYGNAWYQTN
jgi:hypothetical protein